MRDLGAHKSSLVSALGCQAANLLPGERIIIPHVHFVVAHRHVADLKEKLANRWHGPRQTVCKRLYAHQTVPEALTKLYSYTHKRRFQYSEGGINGAEDEAVKFTDPLENHWRRLVDMIYRELDELEVSIFRSKA